MTEAKRASGGVERNYLLWYIIVRGVVLTTVLVSTVVIQLAAPDIIPIMPIYLLVGAGYILSAFYFALYHWRKLFHVQAALQIIFDLLLITGFVYISGGIASSTYFLYIFVVIAAGLVVSGRMAYLAAALAAVFFGLLVDGMYFGLIPYFRPEQATDLSFGSVLFSILLAWAVFFLIAFLVSVLSRNLRRAQADLALAEKELLIKERLAEAGRMAAGVAHEIRNPLAAISGAVQFLASDLVLEPDKRELMDIVVKESHRVSKTIDQFMDFAAPPTEVFVDFNLNDIVEETLKMLRAAGDLNGGIRVEGNHDGPRMDFYGNPSQFKQIFWNLAKNAVRAMPGGGTLTVDFLQPERDRIGIRFADTGHGMSKKDKAHLYQSFYSGFDRGRGLGLATVRRIVDDYDGRIDIHSEENEGTEVTITLPVRKA
ncbi:MAG: ATP-binding protein [Acidobacteriota bacterium]|nr:ATP-binding protein [Acidobacteriota bacterium]